MITLDLNEETKCNIITAITDVFSYHERGIRVIHWMCGIMGSKRDIYVIMRRRTCRTDVLH